MISQHQKFIHSSVAELLLESASLMSTISEGIMLLKTLDYIMQTVFMKMTGYLEQKLKCICWEIASESFEYRYAVYQKERITGFSTYKDKKAVLNDLLKEIKKVAREYKIAEDKKGGVITETKKILSEFIRSADLQKVFPAQIEKMNEFLAALGPTHLLPNSSSGDLKTIEIFSGQIKNAEKVVDRDRPKDKINLQLAYEELVYRHRNRCAHNTLCYQRNNPPIELISRSDYCYYNYFVRFAILLLMDKIFVCVYRAWHDKCCHAYLQ